MCAIPSVTRPRRSFFFFRAIDRDYFVVCCVVCCVFVVLFLFACDRLGFAFARSGVGVGSLSSDGESFSVSESSVASQIEQSFDVHRGIAAQLSFDAAVFFDGFAEIADGLFVEVAHARLRCDGAFGADIFGDEVSHAIDAGECDFHAFGGGDIDSGDSRHSRGSPKNKDVDS